MTRTRAEWLDLLHRCQDGEASCMFVLKEFEKEWATTQPVVKPLVWLNHSSPYRGIHHGRCEGREVAQIMQGLSGATWIVSLYGRAVSVDHPTLEAAQVAAQEQWSAFVQSAISP